MDYRINTFNENYIMLYKFDIFVEITKLHEKEKHTKEEQEILNILKNIINSEFDYKNKNGRKPIIEEIAIDKYSVLGNYIITSEEINRSYITIKEVTNALLACIEKEEWEYYSELTVIIRKLKQEKHDRINYTDFKTAVGTKITEYITRNSRRIPMTYNNSHNNRNVYLYDNDKIIKIKLSAPTVNKGKTKIKSK